METPTSALTNSTGHSTNGPVTGENGSSALIFLGTGCSSAVPNVMCLIQPSNPPCPVCTQSMHLPPDRNPNYRFATLICLSGPLIRSSGLLVNRCPFECMILLGFSLTVLASRADLEIQVSFCPSAPCGFSYGYEI